MKQVIRTADGQLGYSSSAPPVFVLASAAAGSQLAVQTFGDLSLIRAEYAAGRMVDRCALLFTQPSIGAVAALRLATSTAGSTSTVTKTPASTPAQVFFGGALIIPAADQNGLEVTELVPGVSFQIVVAGNNTSLTVPPLTGGSKAVVVNSATDGGGLATSTAAQIATAMAAQATVAAICGSAALGTGATVCGAQPTYSLDKGALYLTPKAQQVRVKNQVSGNSTTLDATTSGGDVTVVDSTDTHALPTGTASAVKTKIEAGAAALVSVALVGDGTGLLAPAAAFVALPYGSTGQVTLSGNPVDDLSLSITIPRAGTLGAGTFQVATDEGVTYGPETLIPGGGTYTIPNTGVTITFAGTFDKNDSFAASAVGAKSNTSDLLAALAILSGITGRGGKLHIAAALTGAQMTSVIAWIASERTSGRIWTVGGDMRDYNTGETESQYVAALQADYTGVTEPQGRAYVIPGWWTTTIPGAGIKRRPFAWAAITQMWSLPIYVNPVCVRDGGGPIPNLYTPASVITPNTHDERLSPGLGGSGGRMCTIQSLPGAVGAWYIGDGDGLRSPGTLAGGTSDWSLLMNAELGAQVERLLLEFGPQLLGTRYDTIPKGQPNQYALTSAERKRVAGEISTFLQENLPGALSAPPIVVVSSTEPTKQSKKLKYSVTLPTWAYALSLDGTIALA